MMEGGDATIDERMEWYGSCLLEAVGAVRVGWLNG